MLGGTVEVSTEFDSMAQSPCMSLGLLSGLGDFSLSMGQWTLGQTIRVTGTGAGGPFDESVSRDLDMSWFALEWSHPWLMAQLYDDGATRWTVDLRSALGAGLLTGEVEAASTPSVIGTAEAADDSVPVATAAAMLKSELRMGGGWSLTSGARYAVSPGAQAIDLEKLLLVDFAVELRW